MYYRVINYYSVLKILISVIFYSFRLYCSIILCDLISFKIVSQERIFYSLVKSYETPFKRRIKIESFFLAHLTPTASKLLDLSFHSELEIFCGCSTNPCLVDLVHAFKGVVVEQFKKRVEKLPSDSILLWRL